MSAAVDLDAPVAASRRDRWVASALAHPKRTILGAYAVSRLVVLLTLWIAATWFQTPAGVGHLHPNLGDMFGGWDGVWYRRIVEGGYPIPLPADPQTGVITYSAWAFYPGFPYLVTPLVDLGVPFVLAGALLNVLLGAVAVLLLWQVFRIGRHAHPQPERERLALIAAVLWCFYPTTAILMQPYTEALAVLLIAASLVLLMQRRYLAVAAVAVALGLTRAVAPALGLVALVHLWVRWRADRALGQVPLQGQRIQAFVMLVVTGVSGILWPLIAGVATGIPTAFFDVQAAWGQRPGSGPFVPWLTWAWQGHGVIGVVLLVGLIGTYVALVLGRHGRWLAIEVRAFAVAYPLYMTAVIRPITSMWRFMMLDVPLAALVASVAVRTSTGAKIVRRWPRRVAVLLVALMGLMLWWTVSFLVYAPWALLPP